MSGIVELGELIKHMAPILDDTDYVFCTVPGVLSDYTHLQPLGSFVESEGLTLIVTSASAESGQLPFSGVYKRITLTVHSSLDAVGLTAAIATRLTSAGISANVVAAYYHDHVFIQSNRAADALKALNELIDSYSTS